MACLDKHHNLFRDVVKRRACYFELPNFKDNMVNPYVLTVCIPAVGWKMPLLRESPLLTSNEFEPPEERLSRPILFWGVLTKKNLIVQSKPQKNKAREVHLIGSHRGYRERLGDCQKLEIPLVSQGFQYPKN